MSFLDDSRNQMNRDGHKVTAREKAGPDELGTNQSPPWEPPVPLGSCDRDVPPFPLDVLPLVLADWVAAEGEATQTPPDLAAMLALAVAGAGLARKFRVRVRDGWGEPTNIFAVCALLPGERKSAVFGDALAPVKEHEHEELERVRPIIAQAESEHRVLEARLKAAESIAAKAKEPAERHRHMAEAKQLAQELMAHKVPEPPQMFCDDVTPEKLANLIATQGGRMLQASAEGTAFEIAKGRYSETANFDVHLKGHAGDSIRVGRMSRHDDSEDQPALSLALAVQPDVIRGLAEQTGMRGRGFLARFLYSLPKSRVGTRKIAPTAMPMVVAAKYTEAILALWRLDGTVDEDGKPAPHWLQLSPAADNALRAFERWLEPQLAEGEDLTDLAGWANKLAGAMARIAAILHMVEATGADKSWQAPICEATMTAAIRLGRDYLLPHALAAFGLMAADPLVEKARHVLAWILKECESAEYSVTAPPTFTKRTIHQGNRRRFEKAEDLDPVLNLLERHGYIRRKPSPSAPGRGHRSPEYEVNPLAVDEFRKAPASHFSQRIHSGTSEGSEGVPPSDDSEVI